MVVMQLMQHGSYGLIRRVDKQCGFGVRSGVVEEGGIGELLFYGGECVGSRVSPCEGSGLSLASTTDEKVMSWFDGLRAVGNEASIEIRESQKTAQALPRGWLGEVEDVLNLGTQGKNAFSGDCVAQKR